MERQIPVVVGVELDLQIQQVYPNKVVALAAREL
jgi:hypothetical protein